jgi:site-specific DNA-methyltransferase (adenine-specific)
VFKWTNDWFRVLKSGGSVFIFAGRKFQHKVISAMEDTGFIFKDMISWEKEIAPHRAQRVSIVYEKRKDYESAEKWKDWRLGNLRPLFEPILWFVKSYKIGGTLVDNILENGVGLIIA